MAILTINGQEIEVDDDARMNVVQAAKQAGIEIPHYCWHPSLSVVASCRMCLVEMGEKGPDGKVAMQPRLAPACQMPAKDGAVVVTDSPKVKQAQAATLEYLLLNHPLDCPTCDQAGECFLQDYSYRFGRGHSRLHEPKEQKPDKDYIGEEITLFTDRCIMCTRCVRFTREISGTAELQVINRGTRSEIDIYPGEPCNNKLAGNVVDLCPVGALCSKDFLYKQRVWWLRTRDSVCPNCSTGCSIHVDQNNETIYRLRPRSNPLAQGDFMCDEGRFGWKYIHNPQRHTHPIVKLPGLASSGPSRPSSLAATNGDAENLVILPPDWTGILGQVRDKFVEFAKQQGEAIAAVFSPWMTVEEAYLLANWIKSIAPSAQLTLGPVPVVGEDDHYPKDQHGRHVPPTKFTIHAEKCPNLRGVEKVLDHFQPERVEFSTVLASAREGRLQAAYVVHPGPTGWLDDSQIAELGKVPFLVVQDLIQSSLSDAAHVVLPGAAFAEKEGTFVNFKNLAQGIVRAVRCPAEGYTDTRIFMELAGRSGMFNARVLRREIAEQIPALAALGVGELGEYGVRLDASLTPQEATH
jgi:NADH-quinone oxidoreductase subunit G